MPAAPRTVREAQADLVWLAADFVERELRPPFAELELPDAGPAKTGLDAEEVHVARMVFVVEFGFLNHVGKRADNHPVARQVARGADGINAKRKRSVRNGVFVPGTTVV